MSSYFLGIVFFYSIRLTKQAREYILEKKMKSSVIQEELKMCIQCTTNAKLIFKNIIPGYSLYQATVSVEKWQAGEYGLVRQNDPDYIWVGLPKEDLCQKLTDAEIDQLAKESLEWQSYEQLRDFVQWVTPQFQGKPEQGYFLVQACLKAGYEHSDGNVLFWLFNHIAQKVGKL
jgi:hypothetical protein